MGVVSGVLWTVFALAVAFSLWIRRHYGHFRRLGLPYLQPLPLVGCMAPVVLRQKSFHDLTADFYMRLWPKRCGGVFTFTTPIVLLTDPDLVRQIAVKDFEHFTDRNNIIPESADALFGKSLFALQGERWKEMRHILSPAFTASKMKNMFSFMKEIAQQMADYLIIKIEAGGGKTQIEMKDFCSRISNDIIASSAFGIQIDSLRQPMNEFYLMGQDVTDFGPKKSSIFMGYILFPKLMEFLGITLLSKKCSDFFVSLIKGAITQREREGILRPDMVHLLMQARKGELEGLHGDNDSKKLYLEDKDLAAQAMIFIFGGFDTVSNLMCFATYLLALHPEVQKRLQEEIDKLLDSTERFNLSYEDISSCKYLEMVISETLRLYPPIAVVDRSCVKPYTLQVAENEKSLHLKPGDLLWVPIFGIHRNPELFPNPEQFDPERFNDDNKKFIKPFSYIPFGLGPRFCIAQRFALMEAKIFLIYLLSQFNLEPTEMTPVPLKLTARGFSATVDGGLWLGINQRNL